MKPNTSTTGHPQTGRKTKSNAEFQRGIIETAKRLAQAMPKHEIKDWLKTTYGIGARSCELWLSRARQFLASGDGAVSSEQIRAVLDSHCRRMLESQDTPESTKVKVLRLWAEVGGVLSGAPLVNLNVEARCVAAAGIQAIDWRAQRQLAEQLLIAGTLADPPVAGLAMAGPQPEPEPALPAIVMPTEDAAPQPVAKSNPWVPGDEAQVSEHVGALAAAAKLPGRTVAAPSTLSQLVQMARQKQSEGCPGM